jgi:hypothetical protein
MRTLVAMLVMVTLGVAYGAEPAPPPDAKAVVVDKKAEEPTPAVAKAADTLATEVASLKKAEKEAEEAAQKERAAIEEAQKVKEIEAQAELVRAMRKAAEYRKAESERRAQRALQPPPEPEKKKSPKVQEILDIIERK